MKIALLAFCLTIAAATSARCNQVAATTPAAKPAVTLKEKSSFQVSAARNPFWPIGWTKPNAQSDVAAPLISATAFVLSAITVGPDARFAILNGKTMQEGQRFGLQVGKQIYQITLRAIEDGQIVLDTPSGAVNVPLHRK